MKLMRKIAMGWKQETTQGTAVVPAAATDYIEADLDSIDVSLSAEKLQRLVAETTLDKRPDVIGKRHRVVSFEHELKGSGTRGDATIAGYAGLHALLQACGFVPVIAASNSIAQVNVTAGGTGFTSAPTIGFTGGGGSGATAFAVISGGAIVAIFVTNPGTGYTTDPTVTITAGGG